MDRSLPRESTARFGLAALALTTLAAALVGCGETSTAKPEPSASASAASSGAPGAAAAKPAADSKGEDSGW